MRPCGWASLGAAIALSACVARPPPGETPTMELKPVAFSDVPGWQDDALAAVVPALRRECASLTAMPPDHALGGDGVAAQLGGIAADWGPLCAAAATLAPGDDAGARQMFERELQPYAVTADARAHGLFTGYYEPEVPGSLRRGGRYQTPILRRPPDLVQADLGAFTPDLKGRSIAGRIVGERLVPYYDRAQIQGGALAKRHLNLLYLADPVDAFFLEIQGSGRVRLPNGHIVRVTYDGQNGRPYVPIGRLLVERGELSRDTVSMQTIRAWLESHPDQAEFLMDANPSYVFFRLLPGTPADQGPPGALGVPLTPERSLAVDVGYLPLGAPVFVATSNPLDGSAWRHLLLAQDRGGAIKGPVRGDIFFGWGEQAETLAGKMQQQGTAFILLPRGGPNS
jgi:membrane-bound lytic murein transglycosylase A